MALQYSVALRNAQLDQIETIGTVNAVLQIWTGTAPATAETTATGTKIVEFDLPADWMAAASAGSKALAGTWSGTGINGGGTAGYFRICTAAAATVGIVQGTIGTSGTDMIIDNASIANGQTVNVTTFTVTAGNA